MLRTQNRTIVAALLAATVALPALAQQAGQNASQQQTVQEILQPNPLLGSVSTEKATDAVIPLSLSDALSRALRYNLSLILSGTETEQARAEQLRRVAELLPDIHANVRYTEQQVNLQAFGLTLPGIPRMVGPFGIFDARAYASQSVFDWSAVEHLRSARASTEAANMSMRNTRELVVLAVGNAYLQSTAAMSRVEAAQAQLTAAQAFYQKAEDMQKAGLVAAIDPLRAKVEWQTRQHDLIQAQNDLDRSKLQLARAIGLPLAQRFELTDRVPYQPLADVDLTGELQRAYEQRPDYLEAKANVRAAELAKAGAHAEHIPTLSLNGDYGDIGFRPDNSHGTFTAAAVLNIPIYAGGRTKADVEQANARLKQRESELADLHSRIEFEVRTAYLDVVAAAKQVEVAQTTLQLANETLTQAQDRFGAGVADNLEVVQAQQSVAAANENYISAVYQHNIAKVILARSLGIAEQSVEQYLKGK